MSSLEIPEIRSAEEETRDGHVRITQSMRDWFYEAKRILLQHGFTFPYASPVEETNAEWIDSYSAMRFLQTEYLLAKEDQFGKDEEFKLSVILGFREYQNKWELEYRYGYPLDNRLNKLLKAKFSDIHAIAIDGEAYSGVLLESDYQLLPATIESIRFIATVVLSRIVELYVFMDERLKV